MKIVIIGGSGLIGTKHVSLLQDQGHDPVAASPHTGVNTVTGEGLTEALVHGLPGRPAWDHRHPQGAARRRPPRICQHLKGSNMKTIVLIHGFWVTPRSWERWIERYQRAGYHVIAPAYPGFEVEVEALNADPSPIEAVTAPAIISHLESVVGQLDEPPIIMGHSAGGAFTQVLLDHGFGAAGVALNSAPTEGVAVTPLSQIKSAFPVLKNPANRHKAVGFTHEQWHYAFTNTFTEEESLALYQRYHIPASGRIFWNSVLANVQPGPQDIHVDYHNDNRAPLLFISGSEDHLMPPKVQRANAKHYKSNTITEVKEYEGMAHLLLAQKGWEEVADYALSWAIEHAGWPTSRGASTGA